MNGSLLVFPFIVYRLTEYVVPGCRSWGGKKMENRPTVKTGRNANHPVEKKESDPLTRESVGDHVLWDDPAHGGVRATDGRGLDEVAGDGLRLGAPGECERRVFHLRDAHTPRRTNICSGGELKKNKTIKIQSNGVEPCLLLAQPLTFQCGGLTLQRSAGDRIFQSVDLDLVVGGHLGCTVHAVS